MHSIQSKGCQSVWLTLVRAQPVAVNRELKENSFSDVCTDIQLCSESTSESERMTSQTKNWVIVMPLATKYWVQKNELRGWIAVKDVYEGSYDTSTFGQFSLPVTKSSKNLITKVYNEETTDFVMPKKYVSLDQNCFEFDGWVFFHELTMEDVEPRIRCIVECPLGDCGKWIINKCGLKEGNDVLYYGKPSYILPSNKFCSHPYCIRCKCTWCHENCMDKNPETRWYCSRHEFIHQYDNDNNNNNNNYLF